MAVAVASVKVPVLENLLDFKGSSIAASSRKLTRLMMNFRSLSLLAVLVLLIVPVECYTDPEEESLNYLSPTKLHLLQRILQKQRQWELDPAIQRSSPFRESKRGLGSCVNSCLTGSGMSFVRCKAMCH